MSLNFMKELEKTIHNYLKERGWDHLLPGDIAKSVMIEGAELLEHFQWENLPLEKVRRNKEKIEEIKKELADVFIYALELSVLLKMDTKKIIKEKLAHSAKKYPAHLMKKHAKRKSGSGKDPLYWQIKKEHRGKK